MSSVVGIIVACMPSKNCTEWRLSESQLDGVSIFCSGLSASDFYLGARQSLPHGGMVVDSPHYLEPPRVLVAVPESPPPSLLRENFIHHSSTSGLETCVDSSYTDCGVLSQSRMPQLGRRNSKHINVAHNTLSWPTARLIS